MSAEARATSHNTNEQLQTALARLGADGLIVQSAQQTVIEIESGAGPAASAAPPPRLPWKTTRRWQQAMARAAVTLYREGDPGDDLRVPIALAMVEIYASTLDDDETLAQLIEAMLPIETASLGGFVPQS